MNKWDLAEKESSQEEFLEYLEKELKGFDFAPIAFICASKGEGMEELVDTALNLHEQASKRVPTAELNRVMETIMAERTPSSKTGKHPKIYYVTQLQIQPPTVGLFVNDTEMFDGTYERFLMNRFREMLPFGEVPIKLLIRGKERERGEGKPPGKAGKAKVDGRVQKPISRLPIEAQEGAEAPKTTPSNTPPAKPIKPRKLGKTLGQGIGGTRRKDKISGGGKPRVDRDEG